MDWELFTWTNSHLHYIKTTIRGCLRMYLSICPYIHLLQGKKVWPWIKDNLLILNDKFSSFSNTSKCTPPHHSKTSPEVNSFSAHLSKLKWFRLLTSKLCICLLVADIPSAAAGWAVPLFPPGHHQHLWVPAASSRLSLQCSFLPCQLPVEVAVNIQTTDLLAQRAGKMTLVQSSGVFFQF